jgi:hypothetical protein
MVLSNQQQLYESGESQQSRFRHRIGFKAFKSFVQDYSRHGSRGELGLYFSTLLTRTLTVSGPYSGAYTTMHPRQANSFAVVAT